MNKLLWRISSTNGRWGVEIAGEAKCLPLFEGRSCMAVPGQLKALGRRAGRQCFGFEAGASCFVVLEEDAEAVQGAGSALVHKEDLQSGDSVTLLHVAPGGVWKWTGYKGRSSGYRMVTPSGAIEDVPTSLLLAAGIVEPKEPPAPAPSPPAFSASFADALRKAGLA